MFWQKAREMRHVGNGCGQGVGPYMGVGLTTNNLGVSHSLLSSPLSALVLFLSFFLHCNTIL